MSEAVTLPPEQIAEEEPQVPTRRLFVFEVGGSAFACEMESFREIVTAQPMTRLPGAPNTVCGLILLLDHFERWIGIGVDDVCDIQDVPIDQFSSADAAETSQPGITGAVEIEGRRVLVLDIKAVVEQVIGQREAR